MDHAATADRERALTELAPGIAGKPWPRIVVVLLSITGLITPFLCLAIAPAAFALSDQDDGFLLAGIGGTHLLLAWSLFGLL